MTGSEIQPHASVIVAATRVIVGEGIERCFRPSCKKPIGSVCSIYMDLERRTRKVFCSTVCKDRFLDDEKEEKWKKKAGSLGDWDEVSVGKTSFPVSRDGSVRSARRSPRPVLG